LLIDTHAHLWDDAFNEDRKNIIASLGKELSCLVEVGVDLKTSEASVSLAYQNDLVFAAVGFHPHDAQTLDEESFNRIVQLAQMDRVKSIGEIGLDYYRNLSPVEDQKKCLIKQLELAKTINKPVILHIREAYADTIKLLKQTGIPKAGGVVHSFLSNRDDAEEFIEMGLFIGIGGPLTFKKNEQLRETVRQIPIEYIVSETDCPYLTPVPYRGKRNQPLYVKYVVEAVSEIKHLSLSDTEQHLYENAIRLFSLPDLQNIQEVSNGRRF